jgi:chromosome segregation ATPase
MRSIKEEHSTHKKSIRMTMDKGTFYGLEYVNQIVRENNIQGVHGPLVNLFTCDEQFNTAVEVTAGGR